MKSEGLRKGKRGSRLRASLHLGTRLAGSPAATTWRHSVYMSKAGWRRKPICKTEVVGYTHPLVGWRQLEPHGCALAPDSAVANQQRCAADFVRCLALHTGKKWEITLSPYPSLGHWTCHFRTPLPLSWFRVQDLWKRIVRGCTVEQIHCALLAGTQWCPEMER